MQRLSRDVTKLSSEAALHQAEIAKLSKRLYRARHHGQEKDHHIESMSALTSTLQTKLATHNKSLSRMLEKEPPMVMLPRSMTLTSTGLDSARALEEKAT